jgi:Peptidase family C25/Propeptide_C25/FlgD Ig-like domain/Peptidase family C25, C terminal ig-like domain
MPENPITQGWRTDPTGFQPSQGDQMRNTYLQHRLWMLIISLCLGVSSAGALDQPLPGELIGATEIISFDTAGGDVSKPTIKVLESDANNLLLEFTLPELAIQALDVDGEIFHAIEIEGGAFRGLEGEPMLPTYSRFIQVPNGLGVEYEVTFEETTEIEGYRPVPMQPGDLSSFALKEDAYQRSGFGNTARTEIGTPAVARDMRLVPITFSPVRYDPARSKLEVASKIAVRVSFEGQDLRNDAPDPRPIIPESFHNLYQNMVINYQGPRDDQIVGLGRYVIICPDDILVLNKLQPLIEWRTRKGYDVYLATTSETGGTNSSIKNWIQWIYDNWDNPPEYIVLVGDTAGNVVMPCWNENYSGYHGETDHPYVQLSGEDILADAHIGRISVTTTDELELYVHKIVSYESTPYMNDVAWYKRGCVTGDPGASGYTTIQQMQWLKSQMLEHNYTAVDTIFTGPWVSQMVAKLNLGDTVFGYRGYLGMSGLDSGQISNLQNGRKMPFAVILTCDSGSFASGYARSEAFMRAGSPPASPTGGIAAIGTATTGTHTRYNNCVTYGIWRSIFGDQMPYFGHCLTRGKYELFLNYSQHEMNNVNIFSSWNNLMGDPAGEMWTGIPITLSPSYPSSVALGTNSIIVDVSVEFWAIEGAYVCLWKDGETHAGGFTDHNGLVEIPIDVATAGEMKLTITKNNYHPYLATITVSQEDQFVGYVAHAIDGDGIANPNESIGLQVQVENFGTISAPSVSGDITTSDPYVTIIDSAEEFGTVSGGATAWSGGQFDIELAPNTPNGHLVQLGLDTHSGGSDWHSMIQFPVQAAEFVFSDLTIEGGDGILDPGESSQLNVEIKNEGPLAGTGVIATLSTTSSWVMVPDDTGTYGNVDPGVTSSNLFNLFQVTAAIECYAGHLADMQLILEFSGGMIDTVLFQLPIGTAGTTDPTGPDSYGYYAFDNTDAGFDEVPAFWWMEIAPNYGGAGTSVGLSDFGDSQDDSRIVDLPFQFTYYGEDFSRATICSNGWLAMGETDLTNYRNWQIPCAGAPPNMIAPMWDNFYQAGDEQVYHYYDEVNHRYIIQWSRLRNMHGGHAISTFQALLYDPAYYPTDTGDGIIVFQYYTYNNTDTLQHYSTTGIQNVDNTTGLLYSYWNTTNTGAAPITSGRAIRFQPVATFESGLVSGHVVNTSDGDADLAGALIRFVETGQTFVSDESGLFNGIAMTGIYTVEVSHPSFEMVTIEDVEVQLNQTTNLMVPMIDIIGPAFSNTTVYPNTDDPDGPYNISTQVLEYSSVQELSLYYANGEGWMSTPLISQGDDMYLASIPGGSGAFVQYYLFGNDAAGNENTDPPEGQSAPYSFWILTPLLNETMEGGAAEWSHDIGSGGYSDQWHLSSEMNHTPIGLYAWKFGDSADGNYADMTDGVLVSPAFDLDRDATLTFWHWMSAEVSGSNPSLAYDGGFLEVSVDGGDWSQIVPELGYTHQIAVGSGPGPYDADTPVYSGDFDWTEASFRLVDLRGEIRIRFRFGSDGSVNNEGWYIDDVKVMPDAPSFSDAPVLVPVPSQLVLYQNQPNPFSLSNASTQIRFKLPVASHVQLSVFDTSGRVVKRLAGDTKPAGNHIISWNGRDQRDQLVGSGVYYYVLKAGDERQTRQMLILR